MHRRIACIALPDIRIEIANGSPRERFSEAQSSALAVVVARPGGAVKTERDVLGNTRIEFVSRAANSLGVRSGQTVAAARAKCAELRVRVVAEGAVHTALARIAEAALAFGPTTAFDVARDVVWVDVGGCSHLHCGELALAQALADRVRSLGHACRVVLADGPRIGAAIARFSRRPEKPIVVVPRDNGHLAMRSLPVAALELDDDVCTWLRELGLATCGDLQKLPRRSLGMRLGERVHDVMQLLDGVDLAPLEPWRPPEVPEERVFLDWGAHTVESLAFVIKTLCDRLAVRLCGRAMAASRLELVLSLDRALCEPEEHRQSFSMALPSPISRSEDLLAVVRARIERCSLPAPVLSVMLRAPELARATLRTLDLLDPEPKIDLVLPRLVAELAAEIGEERVGTLDLVDTWSPHERTRLVAWRGSPGGHSPAIASMASARSRHVLTTGAREPSRIVDASPVSRSALVGARLLARVEGVEWWRRGLCRHDLLEAWLDEGVGWLDLCDGSDEPVLRGWMD
jgi:protein ImuB